MGLIFDLMFLELRLCSALNAMVFMFSVINMQLVPPILTAAKTLSCYSV